MRIFSVEGQIDEVKKQFFNIKLSGEVSRTITTKNIKDVLYARLYLKIIDYYRVVNS